jgi:molybdenum cofactor biosynthesis protein B
MEPIVPLRIGVLTVSDTRTRDDDRSGALAEQLLGDAGHEVALREIVKDEIDSIRAVLGRWIEDELIDAVITTGGTGITLRDVTPEAVEPFVTKRIPGFGELFRWLSYADVGTSTIQSRAEAALCHETLVFVLPGSTGAVRLALEKIIVPQLDNRTRPCNLSELMPRVRPQ